MRDTIWTMSDAAMTYNERTAIEDQQRRCPLCGKPLVDGEQVRCWTARNANTCIVHAACVSEYRADALAMFTATNDPRRAGAVEQMEAALSLSLTEGAVATNNGHTMTVTIRTAPRAGRSCVWMRVCKAA